MTAPQSKPVPAEKTQPNGLDPAVSCWCQPEGPPHSKACPMHESRKPVKASACTYPRCGCVVNLHTMAGCAAGEQSSESRTNAHLAAPRDAARADQPPSMAEVIAATLDALEDNDNHAAMVILKTAQRARGMKGLGE